MASVFSIARELFLLRKDRERHNRTGPNWVSSDVPLIFRQSFDRHVSCIGKLIEDHVDYAKVVAHILVPESEQNFDVKVVNVLNSFALTFYSIQ